MYRSPSTIQAIAVELKQRRREQSPTPTVGAGLGSAHRRFLTEFRDRASAESKSISSIAGTRQGPVRGVRLLLLDRRQNLFLVLQNRGLIFFDRFLIRLY